MEATTFKLDWLVPCVLFYEQQRGNDAVSPAPPTDPIATFGANILRMESIALNKPHKHSLTFTPLAADERLQSGDFVGLDAEFVTIDPQEIELRADGTQKTVKSSQLSVARLSVVRCRQSGHPLDGVPFIDDYISNEEQVADYVTKFSGIRPADLDIALSTKHLSTFKSTYLKLKYLVRLGLVFVGHGLQKDFRVLNIYVPPSQVIDTVELFNLANKRRVSLKLLAWYFLGSVVQSDSVRGHDSVEDSFTAIRLYRYFMELQEREGDTGVERALINLYERGKALQWTVPTEKGSSATKTAGCL